MRILYLAEGGWEVGSLHTLICTKPDAPNEAFYHWIHVVHINYSRWLRKKSNAWRWEFSRKYVGNKEMGLTFSSEFLSFSVWF